MKSVSKRSGRFAGLTAALLLTSSLTIVSVAVSGSAMADQASEEAAAAAFFDYGYSGCDADILAMVWGMDYWEAKVHAGQKVQNGWHEAIAADLATGYGQYSCGQTAEDSDAEEAAVNAFFDYGYSGCDADILAIVWGVDYWQAKVIGGQKVQNGWHEAIAADLAHGYGQHVCGQTSSLRYEDSSTLAELWTAPTAA